MATVTLYIEAWEGMAPRVRPPRVVTTRFLQGRIVGPPHRKTIQLRVLREAVGFMERATADNWLLPLPYTWSEALQGSEPGG
ncbi:MAG: hypothetical protein ACE5JI_22455 [Acidobacteriota bacterium]